MNAASFLKSMFNFATHVFSSLLPKQLPVRLDWSLPFFSFFAGQSCPSLEWRGCLQPWTCKLTSEGEPQELEAQLHPTPPTSHLPRHHWLRDAELFRVLENIWSTLPCNACPSMTVPKRSPSSAPPSCPSQSCPARNKRKSSADLHLFSRRVHVHSHKSMKPH